MSFEIETRCKFGHSRYDLPQIVINLGGVSLDRHFMSGDYCTCAIELTLDAENRQCLSYIQS